MNIGTCLTCSTPMVSQRRPLPEVPEGARRHGGRGLCEACYKRAHYCGDRIDYERRTLSRDDLLDEWEHFTKTAATHTANVRNFATHLGREFKTVERALLRAGITARAHGKDPTL